MRRFVVGGGLSLVLAVAAGAQTADSSYWTLGVSRGFLATSRFARQREASAGSLQLEWRRVGSKVGLRMELGVAQRDQQFGPGPLCDGCYNRHQLGHTMLLASAFHEWRQGRLLRPYAILGGGIQHSESIGWSNQDFVDGRFVTTSTIARSVTTRMGAIMSGGLGLSAHMGRFTAFAEAKTRSGYLVPNELFSLGVRIRPD